MNSVKITNTLATHVSVTTGVEFRVECRAVSSEFIPQRQHSDDAGADLFSVETLVLEPGKTHMFDTGVAFKIPRNYVGYVFNRSSQGKRGVKIPHSVGVVDSGFRDTVKVVLENTGTEPYLVEAGKTRIAQIVISPVLLATFVDRWADSTRGTGGFGSTGS